MNGGLILILVAVLCFLGIVFFGNQMHSPEEVHRVLAGGLAALAGAHAWVHWGPGRPG